MTRLASSDFPFTAVAGQEPLKLALTLCAINPQIGGVLVSGPRGSAKSTLARGLSGVMPALQGEELAPFATLPLGTSEDRLLGALDLKQVLQDKNVVFNPGLLSKAHGGVLYVDEVNLLADHLVDQLLDVSASGVNRVERDGISHEHAARFLLVGTMNPDEGELRPQLKDRFGLMVELVNQYSLEERVQIVRLRDEYDQDSQSFCDAFKYKQRNLKNSIRLARQVLAQVRCSDELRLEVATRCQLANIDGVRGDIVWIRAAMTHAAWRGAKVVALDDIQAVEDLVLAHRRQAKTQNPSPPPSPPPSRRPDDSRSPSLNNSNQPQDDLSQDSQKNEQNGSGEWGSMAPQTLASSSPINVAVHGAQSERRSFQSLTGEVTPGKRKGKQQSGYRPDAAQSVDIQAANGIDWFRSIVSQPQEWPPKNLTHKPNKTGQPVLHLVLLDTSASTLSQGVFAQAKGVILDIANRAYLSREQITILGFGQDSVSSILPKIRAPKEISDLLENLGAGGGTPFRAAMENASQYLTQQHKATTDLHSQTYILTDGRTQADVSGLVLPGNTVLIDTENAPVKRGRGQDIAQHLGAQYVLLNSLLETVL
ncbi:VWA domain-containing protein [Marinomonas rhizomae]|uniref:Magnesium chelatase subunit D n=1 Tax=Marinomonas rhizomae TaxID=491948 RepID=A0A366J6S9_9GAMM|nr:ATP-binding protein [Marinomonas rhizomae]RBP82567.1 magnesium chelatase subunit D [Marinomonas rhizomae]RNF73648.1 VWA domain-containing protein [Marinomonas rhizomae]